MTFLKAQSRDVFLFLAASVLCCGAARAQITAAPRFEVVSIKPIDPQRPNHMGFDSYPSGRIDIGAQTLSNLVQLAYGVQLQQVTGGPTWAGHDRFNILATESTPSGWDQYKSAPRHFTPTPDEQRMLQTMLAERFGLKIHRATITAPVYLLERGKGKLQLTPPADTTRLPYAGIFVRSTAIDGEAHGRNTTMEYFTSQLSHFLDQPVFDRTGITGSYDFDVQPFEPDNHDIVTGFSDSVARLGLRLRAAKAPIEVIVIDAATQPTAD